jgi:ankyrin repeat protein
MDLNAKNTEGDTVLHMAVKSVCAASMAKYTEAVKLIQELVKHGSDVNETDDRGYSVLSICCENKYASEYIDCQIDYLLFYSSSSIFSLIWRRHHYRYNLGLCSMRSGPLSREGSFSCHTCCDTGPRFFRSHPKYRPTPSPLTRHEGVRRIYSNTDCHVFFYL